MFEALRSAEAPALRREDYLRDFHRTFSEPIHRFDKLERGQHFQEPGYDSWEAFHQGDWDNSLSLLEASTPELVKYYTGMTERGLTARRIRVVDFPVTPYIQWEMHVLRLRAELGEEIRVLHADDVRRFEEERTLPELVILGDTVMYEVLYTPDGVGDGTRRYGHHPAVEAAAEEFSTLYREGRDVFEFFEREISTLPRPTASSVSRGVR